MTSGSMLSSSSRSNEYRKTDARLVSVRSRGGSASSRAVTTAWTVGGSAPPLIRGPPSFSGKSMPVVSTMKNGFPPVRSAIAIASSSVIRPPPACRARTIASSIESGSIRRSTALIAFEPQDGRSSKSSVRVSARVSERRPPPRGRVPRRSIRSSMAPLSVWASSTTMTTGCSAASPSMSDEEPGVHVVDERRFVPALGDAEQQSESIDETVDVVRPGVSRGELVEPLSGLLGGVAVLDPREVGDDRGDRGERRGLGVRAGARHHERHPLVQTGEQLVGEPRLADPRLPGDRHEDGHPGRGRAGEALAQDRHLARSPDERDRPARGPGGESFHRVRGQVHQEALRADVPALAERDLRLGERVRRLAHEHLAGSGRGLEPGRRVHDRPGDQELSRGPQTGGRHARLDPHAHLERIREPERDPLAAEPSPDRQSCSDRTERVVLVDRRESEDRHHGVADELLRAAAERLQLLGGRVEEPAQDLARALRVEALREPRRIDEIGEQHRDHLAFLGPERGRHDRPAVGAEPGAGGQRMTADGTRHARQHRRGLRPRCAVLERGGHHREEALPDAGLERSRRRRRWRSNG